MYNSTLRSSLMALFCMLALTSLSQTTTTFDYPSFSFSSIDCNIFSPSVGISGSSHQSHAGGVALSSSTGRLLLATTPSSTTPGATAFVINYNFTQGNNYNIKITALAEAGRAMILKTSVVPNLNQFTTPSTTSCTPANSAWNYNTVGLGRMEAPVSTSSTVYTVPQFNTASTHPYLIVWAIGGRPSLGIDYLEISKIEITSTPISPSFTIPSAIELSCGSTSPISVGVTNTNNTPGVTGYTWTLGNSTNTWNDANGNPVGSTITTTTNTLSLTPVCVSTTQTISVTVAVGSTNYQTNTGNINIVPPSTLPTYTVSGPDILCTTGTYSVSGLPCGATVQWTTSGQPGPLLTLSPTTGSSTTATYGSGGGNEFVIAHVTSCGQTQTIYKKVRCGPYTSESNFTTSGPNYPCKNATISLSVNLTNYPGLSNLVWSYPPGWTYITSGGNYIVLKAPNSTSPPTYSISVTADNVCGTSSTAYHFIAMSNCSGFRLSPNPANDAVTITEYDNNTGLPIKDMSIKRVQIISKMGEVIFDKPYTQKLYGSLRIPFTRFKPDSYVARIFDGVEWKSYQLIIRP